jgi:hypothetical protein
MSLKKMREGFSNLGSKKMVFLYLFGVVLYFLHLHSSLHDAIKKFKNLKFPTANIAPIHTEQKAISELEERIKILESNIEADRLQIENLSLELVKTQNQSPERNVNNIKILITVFEIAEKIDNGDDFMEKYEFLKIISSGKRSIYDMVVKIGNYSDYNVADVEKAYWDEYSVFAGKDNKKSKNKIRQFFDENLIIRKINNLDTEKDDGIDVALSNLSSSIRNKKYERSLDIINTHGLSKDFPKTREIVERRKELKELIRDILLILYKEY